VSVALAACNISVHRLHGKMLILSELLSRSRQLFLHTDYRFIHCLQILFFKGLCLAGVNVKLPDYRCGRSIKLKSSTLSTSHIDNGKYGTAVIVDIFIRLWYISSGVLAAWQWQAGAYTLLAMPCGMVPNGMVPGYQRCLIYLGMSVWVTPTLPATISSWL